ncbi:hypothetical protein MMC07_004060 [Pseudocyphellaria aurata]|nr:hypothetical protein [Pseudocyphellaria aurata]
MDSPVHTPFTSKPAQQKYNCALCDNEFTLEDSVDGHVEHVKGSNQESPNVFCQTCYMDSAAGDWTRSMRVEPESPLDDNFKQLWAENEDYVFDEPFKPLPGDGNSVAESDMLDITNFFDDSKEDVCEESSKGAKASKTAATSRALSTEVLPYGSRSASHKTIHTSDSTTRVTKKSQMKTRSTKSFMHAIEQHGTECK